jgi:DNA-binding response OmpR family regulator
MGSSFAPPLILVAEDDPDMRELVAEHLKCFPDLTVDILVAEDGEEAWRIAQERLPDVVILDVMMPGLSGWDVCRKIRENAGLRHTGVVMLTGIGEVLNETTSPLFGADEFIDKPFDPADFYDKVRATLDKRASQRESVPRSTHVAVPEASRLTDDDDEAPTRRMVPKPAKRAAKKPEKVFRSAAKKAQKPAAKPAAKKTAAKKTVKAAASKAHSRKKTAVKSAASKKAAPKKLTSKAAPKKSKVARSRTSDSPPSKPKRLLKKTKKTSTTRPSKSR